MERFFLKLVNMSITAGWLILAILVLRLLLRKAPKWISCLLWGLVAIRLIFPISLESIFSMVPNSEPIHQDIVMSARPAIDSGVVFLDNMVNPALGESFAPAPGASANPLQIWIFVASVVWAVGVFFMLAFACISYLRLRHKVRTAVRLRDSIYVSEFVDMPFILGVIRPRIYLPIRMEEAMRESVIAHEKAHLKRGDHLWKPFAYALLSVYWFHPLCWVAYSMLCKDIELACDEKVIKNYDTHQKKAYSEALLECSLNRRIIAGCPLAFGEVGVRERIKSVLHYKKPAFWMIVTAVVVCIVAAVCFLTNPVKREADSQANENEQMDSVSQDQEYAGNQEAKMQQTPEEPGDFLLLWKSAFVNRDGNTIALLASDEVIKDLEARDMLVGTDGQRSFGNASPWPRDEAADAVVDSFGNNTAQIYYYAWTFDPYVTVWKETLTYEVRDGRYVITGEALTRFDDIASGEEFLEAYGSEINYTRIDYLHNGGGSHPYLLSGMGDVLNENAVAAPADYGALFQPESAAAALLHLSDDSRKVEIERIFQEGSRVGLRITFFEDDSSFVISMVQYDAGGVWIPQDYQVDPFYRLIHLDWDEVRSRNLTVYGDKDWTDIICIGRIPEKDITIYGYNDKECGGEGVAIEIGDDVNYFDWIYTSPRAGLPDCYWNEEKRQLQISLPVYSGTGISAQDLHVLQYHDTGTLADNDFDLHAFSEIFAQRLDYEYDEKTKRLTLMDSQYGKELATIEIEEKVVGIDNRGMISGFVLGDTIMFQVEPGFFIENSPIPYYHNDMPVLEAEVLLQKGDNGILFGLGEFTVSPDGWTH